MHNLLTPLRYFFDITGICDGRKRRRRGHRRAGGSAALKGIRSNLLSTPAKAGAQPSARERLGPGLRRGTEKAKVSTASR